MSHQLPRVAAVHDISGFGRCSLTVILPVLSAMGIQCCPLPTAYLSAHTGFPDSPNAVFLDMTQQVHGTGRHWTELGLSFQAIYSGFLGAQEQIDCLEYLLPCFRRPHTLVLVDPVMGDHGRAYRTYTPQMCRRMTDLARLADLITPNFTEAAILLKEDYQSRPMDEAGVRDWLDRLSLDGKRSVVLTGVSFQDGLLGAACLDRESGTVHFPMAQRESGSISGTGDLFAAVLLGGLLRGEDLDRAATRAVTFTSHCVGYTLQQGTPLLEGVLFESLLKELMS